jgi:predicted choloylglycine hydrolase
MLLSQGFADLYRLWSCTTIGAVGEASDEPILGRNLDFVDMGFLHRYSYVVVAKPEKGEPYISVSWPGLIGVLSGMNRAGVSLAVMVVHDEHSCRAGVPFQLAFRRALATSKTAADVESCLRGTQLTVTNNLMVVDAQGGASVLELTPSGLTARGPEHGRLYSTNHFLTDERRESRISLTYLSSRRRLSKAEKTCDAAEKITVPVAIEGLRASAAEMINVQAMVFRPRSGDVWVGLGKPPAAAHAFVHLEKSELLGN